MSQMREKLTASCKVWVSSGDALGVFGGGKLRLLRMIHQKGSLKEAAEALEISYRKAWGDLKKAESCLGVKLIVKERGGVGGGRTTITNDCQNVLDAYEQLQFEMESQLQKLFSQFRQKVAAASPPMGASDSSSSKRT